MNLEFCLCRNRVYSFLCLLLKQYFRNKMEIIKRRVFDSVFKHKSHSNQLKYRIFIIQLTVRSAWVNIELWCNNKKNAEKQRNLLFYLRSPCVSFQLHFFGCFLCFRSRVYCLHHGRCQPRCLRRYWREDYRRLFRAYFGRLASHHLRKLRWVALPLVTKPLSLSSLKKCYLWKQIALNIEYMLKMKYELLLKWSWNCSLLTV